MLKKIGLGVILTVVLTWVLVRVTGFLPLGPTADNLLFASSPIIAAAIAVMIVRKRG
jgi:hypothetical protein